MFNGQFLKVNEIQQRDCSRISLGLVLFSTFSVGKGMDSKISMFVDDTKLF